MDTNAILHLAWNWRETPDVASNHDLYYARSKDFGISWEDSDNKLQNPPFRLGNAERVVRVPEMHNLMNPPQVSADSASKPYIGSYWSPKVGENPQFQVLHKTGDTWRNIGGPASTEHFYLSGIGTKNPPISRAILFIESNECVSQPHLIYRDRALNGRILVASYSDDQERWKQRILLDEDTGAWEPSMDPVHWQRLRQIHMLVQNVFQQDSNDQTSNKQSSSIYSLAWKVDSITECKTLY